ncbi:MAG: DnaJ domain-containing protein [Desulfobacterales bacterium]|nr:DnaJ domain-containing protein [Desulfobacterales bacterium]
MDIGRCFDILELDRDATIDEAKQAYKDLVNIWHPDRFSDNPRLKQKAEDKLKEINEAYETAKFFLSPRKPLEPEKTTQAKAGTRAGTEAKSKTEAFVEAGTGIVLSLLSCLSSAFRRIVAEAKTELDQAELKQWQKGDDKRGKGRGRGMGRGKSMGRGGGGRGRGRS